MTLSVLAACLVLPAAPASADEASPQRVEDTSALNSMTGKFAQAECDPGEAVVGMGGWINGGNGRVAMTGIVPNANLTMVTVYGRELLGGTNNTWSVTAIAICLPVPGPGVMQRAEGPAGQYVAQAECPPGKILYANGYHLPSPDGDEFLRALHPSADLKVVTARADGPGVDPDSLFAYGVCGPTFGHPRMTRSEPTPSDTSSPKSAVAGLPEDYHFSLGSWMFGAGATVGGASGILIDALVPLPSFEGSYGRAQKATPGGISMLMNTRLMDDEEDWDLVVHGNYIGEWY